MFTLATKNMTIDKEKWSLPSPTLVMECIERWRNLDLRELSDSDIDRELSDFLDKLGHYPVSTAQTTPFKSVTTGKAGGLKRL